MAGSNRRILATIVVLSIAGISMKAQNIMEGPDAAKEINRIKTLSEYVYAEATSADRDTAIVNAGELLKDELRYTVKDSLLTAQAYDSKRIILTRRGTLTRAFAYTIRPLNIGARRESQSAAPAPAPATTAQAPEPVSQSRPAVGDQEDGYILFAEETRMVSVQRFDDIYPYITGLSYKNILKEYGKYATLPASGECYMFVYNKDQEVVACLKRTDGRQINLGTRHTDDIKNYKNCGAIWFTLK